MTKIRYGFSILVLMILMSLGSSVWAASISGTVTNNSGKSGRIYLKVNWSGGGNTGIGVSIPAAGPFTIRGVQQGNYTVNAFMDATTPKTGIQHANDPSGMSVELNVSSADFQNVNITLNNPTPQSPVAPSTVDVLHSSDGNMLFWDGDALFSGDVPVADKYTVSWSASSGGAVLGSMDVVAGLNDFFFHKGGTTDLYYQVKSVVGLDSAASGWVSVSTADSGTGSITGKVNFPGPAVTGTLYVFAMSDVNFFVKAVTSPVSGGTYTISNLPPGNYEVFAFVDQNDNGTYDLGDIGWRDDENFPKFSVATSAVTASDIAIENVNATKVLATKHVLNEWGDSYYIGLTVQQMKKQVANVEITSGVQIPSVVDLAVSNWSEFDTSVQVAGIPIFGDTYQIKVTYIDSALSPEIVVKSVTGVITGVPTATAPIGNIVYNATPTFSWTAPTPPPTGEYVYNLWSSAENGYGAWWDVWGIPSSDPTSLPYASTGDSGGTLADGTKYRWTIKVSDKDGNSSESQSTFTPTTAPAINSFSPAGGLAGTTVYITGINFNLNPASNLVYFNGLPASVSAATSTTLTVTVPNGATTGKIQVGSSQSSKNFIVGAAVIIQGVVKTSGDIDAIAGARVESVNDSSIYTTTAADGSFSLSRFANESIALKITKSGYVPTYTRDFWLSGNLDLTPYPSHLYTQAELTSWGVTTGKGVIIGRAMNYATTPYTPVGGVVVTAQGSISYPVTYYSGTAFEGSATYSNGIYFVKNVDPYQWININATKTSWYFQNTGFSAYANSVTEGGIFGSTQPPYINEISPLTGKSGTSVTITGGYFSAVPAENIVTINGVTATVTAASANSLTVTVPAAATTGQISVTTAGGSYTHWQQTFTMRNTLTASVAGSVGGTVTSVPTGISCTTTGCTADFDQGTSITLTATESTGYKFKIWSVDCTGTTDTCSLTLSTNKSVTATFEQLLYIKNGTTYYSSLQDAFDGAATGNIIQTQEQVFTDLDLVFNRASALVTFKGGYDSTFATNSGYTTLDGKLSVRGGTLRMEKLKIK